MTTLLFDKNNSVHIPTLILESKGGDTYGKITNFTDFVYKVKLNSANEISFTVYKYENGTINHLWNNITDLKTVYIPEYDEKFQITVSYSDAENETKTISGTALCEAELGQIYLRNFECNTNDDLELHDYNVTKFYDPDHTDLSLLHRVLQDKAAHFHIGKVDETLRNLSYEFSADEQSIYDFLTGEVAGQVHCIFEFDSMTRTVNAHDLYSTCKECKEEIIGKEDSEFPDYRDDFHDICPKCGNTNIIEGYGNDTVILIDKENLSNSIVRETDVDSLKNCFYVEGGDDDINAAFILANPNGSRYIYYFSPELLSEMPAEFKNAYDSYSELYDKYYYGSDDTAIDTAKTTHKINENGDMSSGSFDASHPDSNYVKGFNDIVDMVTSLSPASPYSDFKTYKSETIFYGQPNLVAAYYNTIDLESFLQTKMMPTYEMEEYDKYHALSLLTADHIGTIGIPEFSSSSTTKTVVENAILQAAKTMINTALFRVGIHSSEYNPDSQKWSVVFTITDLQNDNETTNTITNLTYQDIADKENYTVTDTISSSVALTINSDYTSYTQNRIHYLLTKKDLPTSIDLYKPETPYHDFVSQLKYHSKDNLTLFFNVLTSCREVLQEIKGNVTDTTNAVLLKIEEYDKNYYDKMTAINEEIQKRENQIEAVHNYGLLLYAYITDIQSILNFQKYLQNYGTEHHLSTDLWNVFNYYRRESTYRNGNIISDSLKSNADLLQYAGYLMSFAKKEAIKAGTPQMTIQTTLNNLLALPEFKPIVNDFKVGNWIRVRTDIQDGQSEASFYKLRLLSYTITYDSLDQIDVEFSTVSRTWSGLNDVSNIMKSAQSTATSVTAIAQQINKNTDTYHVLKNWVNDGLDLTNQMIVSDAYNQNLVIDEHGLLARKYDDFTEKYDACQLKIFNNGLYTTSNGWKTIDAGIGKICYIDPENGTQVNDYGIIARKIIGTQILGEELKIISGNGSVKITGDGIVMNKGSITWENVNSPAITDIDGLNGQLSDMETHIDDLENYKEELSVFRKNVDKGLSTLNNAVPVTKIGEDYVISPKIGAQYLYVTKDNYSIEIDPSHSAGDTHTLDGYLFAIRDKNKPSGEQVIMGVDTNGQGYFHGKITGGNIQIGENFRVDDNGIVTATDGNFIGNMKLKDGLYLEGSTAAGSWYQKVLYFDDAGGEDIEALHLSSGIFPFVIDNHLSCYDITCNTLTGNVNGCAKTLACNGDINSPMTFHWAEQTEQPTWLWGCNDKTNMYLYNPSKFNVKYAKYSHRLEGLGTATIGTGYFVSIGMDKNSNDCFRSYDYDGKLLDGVMNLGAPGSRWMDVYATNGIIQTSDRNLKDNMIPLSEQYMKFFMQLMPVSFTFKDGKSGRTHIGFISQDVEAAMAEVGFTDSDFAGFCKDAKVRTYLDEYEQEISEPVLDADGNPEYTYSLRYEEFIALNTHMIQKTISRIDSLESENNNLKQRIETLEQAMAKCCRLKL